jgi:hypothetical protein
MNVLLWYWSLRKFPFFVCSWYLIEWYCWWQEGNALDGFIYKSAKIGTLNYCFCPMIDRLLYDGFIVESVKIGQSAIFNGWMFLLRSLCKFLFFVCRKLVSDFICKSLRLVLWTIALVPLNQVNWQFLTDDMFQNIDISNIYRTNEMIHIILLVLLCNHPCPTYTVLHLLHL